MKKIGIFTLVVAAVYSVVAFSQGAPAPGDVVVLTNKNTLVLNTEVDGESVSKVIVGAKKLQTKPLLGKPEPIYLFLNTPGGRVDSGLELIDALNSMERPVKTITLFAASMGFQIVQNLDERLILNSGELMSHRARGGFQGEFGGQEPSQLTQRYESWKTKIRELDEKTVARTGEKQTLASYQSAYENEMWISGSNAVNSGYADRVVKVRCDESLKGVTTHSIQFYGMEVKFDLDNCPMNTAPMNIQMTIDTTKGRMLTKQFLSQGGKFGAECLISTNPEKLCALDTTASIQKFEQIKSQFASSYSAKQKEVVYMTIGK